MDFHMSELFIQELVCYI